MKTYDEIIAEMRVWLGELGLNMSPMEIIVEIDFRYPGGVDGFVDEMDGRA